ncbi:MAG: GspE/PulE family protein [Nitrospira sp.]|jgi:type II secretory ATPase GspE/PulE/Tfp pilus assembly ATPase PilB-like protein|nr:GspE/PulE family protein [Nitrospira sp.]
MTTQMSKASVNHGVVVEQMVSLVCRATPVRSTVERQVLHLLVQRDVVTLVEMEDVLESLRLGEGDLEAVLLDQYRVPKAELGAALGEVYQCPYIPYEERTVVDPGLLKNLSVDYLRKNAWVPLQREGSVVTILIGHPSDAAKRDDVRRAFPGATIRYAVGLRRDIEQYLLAATGQAARATLTDILGELVREAGNDPGGEGVDCGITEHDSAIVRLANHIIAEAHRLQASDVHIEPYANRKDTAVRFRVDGTCFTFMRIPAACRRAIVSRLKIMAHLDIAERRKPQDGKIRYRLAKDQEIELRVATLPTAGGNEDVVMRLLTTKDTMALEAMECAPEVLRHITDLAERPYGMFLCVGPTGAGKTTTLHAVLKHINTDERKIWTAEDPIEITQDGLRQVQIHPKIGFTFAAAMRSFLRADPDVIMIGEMRDRETADIAIEASLTGHLVLSTLHTNSAAETVTRLLEMGCDAFNFADAMLGVLAQRLCKRLCSSCKEAYQPTQQEYDELVMAYGAHEWERLGLKNSSNMMLWRGRGCTACNQSGFKGRVALHELLVGSDEIKRLIQAKARTLEIASQAMREGMVTLRQHGIQKVLQGVTTYRQVRSVAMK